MRVERLYRRTEEYCGYTIPAYISSENKSLAIIIWDAIGSKKERKYLKNPWFVHYLCKN